MIRDALDPVHKSKRVSEKKEQLSPQDEEDLEEAAAQYHSGEDWSIVAKSAPKSLRKTSPIRSSIRSRHQTVKSSKQEKKNMRLFHPPPYLPLSMGIRGLH